jgi:hypothetical protein
VNTPLYEERKHDLVQAARSSAFEIPLSSRSEVIERGTYEELRTIPTVFRFRPNPDMLLDVSLRKALLDGPEAARHSCFSFAVR